MIMEDINQVLDEPNIDVFLGTQTNGFVDEDLFKQPKQIAQFVAHLETVLQDELTQEELIENVIKAALTTEFGAEILKDTDLVVNLTEAILISPELQIETLNLAKIHCKHYRPLRQHDLN